MERIDKGDLVYDVEARWEAMKEAEAILLGEDEALAPLYQQGNTYLINPKLKGVTLCNIFYHFEGGLSTEVFMIKSGSSLIKVFTV